MKKRKSLVIALIGVIGLVLGSTLAWYTWVSTNTDVTFTIGGITITYEAGSDMTGTNLRPVSTKEVGVENSYAIKKDITVSSNKEAYFSLYLTAETFPSALKQESLRWELYEGTTKLSDGNFISVTEGNKFALITNTVINSTTRNLSLYIWIDGNMDNPSEMQNQTYKFVLNAEATDNMEWVDPSGANAPELLDGMVPVRYQKCGEIDEITEETYPECYTKRYTKINDADRAAMESICVAGNYGTEEECSIIVDTVIETGEVIYGGGSLTLQEIISIYEGHGGVMTSPYEMILIRDKELSGLIVTSSSEWYNYNEQKWANAVLVNDVSLRTASAGTVISEEKVLAYYVWVPRYKYKLFNAEKKIGVDSYNAQTTGIDIVFERGTSTTGTVSCTISSTGVENCENAANGNYYTHPAFWWDKDSDRVKDNGEDLTGIWVGKFEISSSNPQADYGGGEVTDLAVRIKPNVPSWRYNTVSNYFTVIQNMNMANNEYGLNPKESDSHMMKNMEWGAVAYLTNSKYGRCPNNSCEEVTINNSSDYITGSGGYEETNAYDSVLGVKASTTGNFYGVYDMSGGSYEYVMGNLIYSDGKTMISGVYEETNSGYNGILQMGGDYTPKIDGKAYPYEKYYDIYSNGETSTDQAAYSRGHLGDATGEVVVSSDYAELVSYAWYSDWAYFLVDDIPWFMRGNDTSKTSKGVFAFEGSDGGGHLRSSARAVLLSSPQLTQ